MAKEPTYTVDICLSNIPDRHYDIIMEDIMEQIYEVMQDYDIDIKVNLGVGQQENTNGKG